MDLRVTLKFLKRDRRPEPAVTFQSTSQVYRVDDPNFAVNNAKETIVCLCVPRGRVLPLRFKAHMPIRRIVAGQDDLAFAEIDDHVALTLPALHANLDQSACFHTFVHVPGVELRIEHADSDRRAGKYESGAFPLRQHRAVVNIQFALLHAVRALGLDRSAGCSPFGPIWIMGFDTNNPAGHTDWPPHFHMHMAQPRFGAPVGHYYLDEDCKITHNLCQPRADAKTARKFGRDEPCRYLTPTGEELFSIMITGQGDLTLRAPDGSLARLSPAMTGFDEAVQVDIDGKTSLVAAQIDSLTGRIALGGDAPSTLTFDTDTGRLTSDLSDNCPDDSG